MISPIRSLVNGSIATQINFRRKISLLSTLELMAIIAKEYKQFLNDEVLLPLLAGLKYLENETNPETIEECNDFSELILFRKRSARVAYLLFKHVYGAQQIPEVINDWKLICSSDNEFSEIKNEWGYA